MGRFKRMRIFGVDAFADESFKGNPAIVCILDSIKPDSWMQSIASELNNLSETAFVLKQTDDEFSLRWFTPKTEVNLCGHATLASAHILWEEHILNRGDEVRFHTKSGLLTAKKNGNWIEMEFPARMIENATDYLELNEAIGIKPIYTGRYSSPSGDIYLLEVESATIVKRIKPNFELLSSLNLFGVIVTSKSDQKDYDFISRFFAPAIGTNEDPATGSAHCYLAPYWGTKLNKRTMIGFQASERTGIIGCEWKGNMVILKGKAITIFKGNLLV
jgi:PhzF family phenazine biosynthesis protein